MSATLTAELIKNARNEALESAAQIAERQLLVFDGNKELRDIVGMTGRLIAASIRDIKEMPTQPPCTNEFVAPGCEQFSK